MTYSTHSPRFWRSLCALALWAASSLALAQRLPPDVANALARAKVPQDAVSLYVARADGLGSPRLSHRASVLVNPASVMKLVTTFAALDTLGADYTWKTRFYADGPLKDGVLYGNLYIQGGGDPKLVLERIAATFAALQTRGVQKVRGDIVLDHHLFEPEARDPAEFDGQALSPYNTAPDGLLVNFKSLIFTFTPEPDSGIARIRSEPPIADVQMDAQVPLSTQSCNDWRGALQAEFANPDQVHFGGSYPVKCGERVWPVAYTDPASYARRVLQAMYLGLGGSLTGVVRDGRTPGDATWLMDAPSLPLGELIADVNKFSNNVMAQQMFLTLGLQAGRPGTFAASRAAVAAWWPQAIGRNVPVPTLENGSGLSRDERTSASALGQLLRRAAAHPQAAVFAHSLSVAGVDGTAQRMRDRGLAPESIGNAQLKTGTLRDVASVAGYATGRSGQRYVVVGIVNHPLAPAARPALDALVEWAVKE
ncbi:D-alanyl-D-alanine carboxypeptidase/D-alanyl-D-alanine-endopeptidase [Rhodoferax sp. WC2427]|uniref:D-alanyl-D-alanine carboxypeptidase/D-alanyl-D-alanine endopeptidase n=1 Tax=Rhodoferax sp. WC2427 TaxID=3234144 RepID=UPI003466BBC7